MEFPKYEVLDSHLINKLPFELSSEFGLKEYNVAKKIYESNLDKKISIREIKKVTGLENMSVVYYAIFCVIRDFDKQIERLKDVKMLQYYWNGINDWVN